MAAYTLADHVRLAREAWERGHAICAYALQQQAEARNYDLKITEPPEFSGTALYCAYIDLMKHLRVLEPYLGYTALVDDVNPWMIGRYPHDRKSLSKYGFIVVPLAPEEAERMREEHWNTALEHMLSHARSWRERFDALESRFAAPLNVMEQNIVEAIGDATLTGPKIAKLAGYEPNSRFRQTLSSLVKRKLLLKTGHGYHRGPMSRDIQ